MVFALLLKPVAVEESEEIEEVLLGKRTHEAALFFFYLPGCSNMHYVSCLQLFAAS